MGISIFIFPSSSSSSFFLLLPPFLLLLLLLKPLFSFLAISSPSFLLLKYKRQAYEESNGLCQFVSLVQRLLHKWVREAQFFEAILRFLARILLHGYRAISYKEVLLDFVLDPVQDKAERGGKRRNGKGGKENYQKGRQAWKNIFFWLCLY